MDGVFVGDAGGGVCFLGGEVFLVCFFLQG